MVNGVGVLHLLLSSFHACQSLSKEAALYLDVTPRLLLLPNHEFGGVQQKREFLQKVCMYPGHVFELCDCRRRMYAHSGVRESACLCVLLFWGESVPVRTSM